MQLEIIELNDEINITAGATFEGCTIDDNSINEFIQFLERSN
ncbi:hypothetical protein [Clostridium algidicarnis]|nr:hypothetical protein [Clostridium algidicarnis]